MAQHGAECFSIEIVRRVITELVERAARPRAASSTCRLRTGSRSSGLNSPRVSQSAARPRYTLSSMDLRQFLEVVARDYDRKAGLETATQELLRKAPTLLRDCVPGHLEVRGSGGVGKATFTPWVGFFDPDETSTARKGLFVAYLFSEDLQHVFLVLLQGVTTLRRQVGDVAAEQRLAVAARAIRKRLGSRADGLDTTMDLRSSGLSQAAYEAGCVVALRYQTDLLPTEQQLRTDLRRFLDIYSEAIRGK